MSPSCKPTATRHETIVSETWCGHCGVRLVTQAGNTCNKCNTVGRILYVSTTGVECQANVLHAPQPTPCIYSTCSGRHHAGSNIGQLQCAHAKHAHAKHTHAKHRHTVEYMMRLYQRCQRVCGVWREVVCYSFISGCVECVRTKHMLSPSFQMQSAWPMHVSCPLSKVQSIS